MEGDEFDEDRYLELEHEQEEISIKTAREESSAGRAKDDDLKLEAWAGLTPRCVPTHETH